MTGTIRRSWIPHPAFLALLLLAACGGGDGASRRGVIRDTIGDTIVVRAAAAGAWGDSASVKVELRIGALDGPEAYTFGRIAGMAVASDGVLYVLDQQVPVVRVYDAGGNHLRDIGREGGGPGEMRRPVGLGILPDGRIILRDEGNARFDLFTSDGESAGEWRMPGGYSTSVPFTVGRDGHVYTPIIAVRHQQGGWDHGLLHYDSTGAIVDTVTIPYEDFPARSLVAVHEGARAEYSAPFEPRSHWAMSPEGYVVAGVSDRYAIDLFRPAGHVLRLQRAYHPVPVHPDERSDAIANVTSGLRQTDPDWDWRGPAAPTEKPAYAGLQVDDEGRIWVRLHGRSTAAETRVPGRAAGEPDRTRRIWSEPLVYDVWTADGQLLGTVQLPDRFRPWVMRGDQVWGVLRDEDNVEYVVLYRVITE